MLSPLAESVCQFENAIASRIGAQDYKLWFKNATRFTIADEHVRVEVPNVFVGEWIERHFIAALQEAAEEVTSKPLEIVFSIDPAIAKDLRRKQPDSQSQFAADNPERLARKRKRRGTTPDAPRLPGTFDTFIMGESNRLAHSCARVVSESPCTQYNPLFLHGGSGIGKTHLLQAICNELTSKRPELRWKYVTGEEFTNQFIYAIKNGERDAFHQRFRRLDVLVIDDVHFFANKRATQEEFLHTFNAIDASGKQIVMASDAHPKLIGHLSEHLVSRFIAGMVVKIDSPDHHTRVGVLQKRAAKLNFEVRPEIIEYIAANFQANVRELEGALLKLVALARLSGVPLTLPLAHRALGDLIEHTVPIIKLTDIESAVSIFFGLSPDDLHTTRKTRTIALARGVAMYLARTHTAMSFPEIGRFMGNKNHSTVILACRRIKKILSDGQIAKWATPAGEKEGNLANIITQLEDQLGLGPKHGGQVQQA
ncbi:MAG: chromosomal replication initiator protein DnaA [Planctomycetes bacterium]|nr:chromosomal replication initiator protein DnaA [Planctomycetota bacterium]